MQPFGQLSSASLLWASSLTFDQCVQERDASTADSSRIQVWQRSNWHWYLKREICGLGSGEVFTAWQEVGLCLTTITSDGLCSEVGLASSYTQRRAVKGGKSCKNVQGKEVMGSPCLTACPGPLGQPD